MLAARNGKNNFCIPFDGLFQRIVSRRVARVQRHHHIDLVAAGIRSDVTLIEMQLFIAVFLRQSVADCDDILFQVKSDDIDIQFFQFAEVIIHRKRQIRFSAAEIENRDFAVRWELRQDIFDELQKAVDLAELVVAGPHDFAFFCHNTEIL